MDSQTIREDAPKAVTAASGAIIAQVETSSTPSIYAKPSRPFKRIIVEAMGPNGRFEIFGQVGKALVALVEHGADGVTALEVSSWAYSLARMSIRFATITAWLLRPSRKTMMAAGTRVIVSSRR